MPSFTTRSGARLHYQVRGKGTPVLLLAPGGMRSSIDMWASQPYDAWSKLPPRGFSVIAMDQRNAGRSRGPLGCGWATYRDDQLALLDELGVGRCLLLGSCIGPSYQLSLMKAQPSRFPAAVMMQPIGLARHTTEPGPPWTELNTQATRHWYGHWAREMADDGRFGADELGALRAALFAGEHRDFVFSVRRSDVAALHAQSLLVFMGRDIYHPSAVAREIVQLAPSATLIERWRDEEYTPAVDDAIESFMVEEAARLGRHA